MLKRTNRTLFVAILLCTLPCLGQTFSGVLSDRQTGVPLENADVRISEGNLSVQTDVNGRFSLTASDNDPKTLSLEKAGYMYEEYEGCRPQADLKLSLRKKKMSAASLRWEGYMKGASHYNSPEIPNDPNWTVQFKESDLLADLAPDSSAIRRDPSAVLKVNDLYYVWYTKGSGPSTWFKPNQPYEKVFPWDLCDIWYATSSDGWSWKEMGSAVVRGAAGSFDDRSVFTPEVFGHQGKYYLVYQAVQAPYVQRVKNVVAMAVADSPDGPWAKLPRPILRPTNNGIWAAGSTSRHDAIKKGDFDSHKVHDPCLVFYKEKFYLYYKGERMGEERFFGQREIKWGVAIAERPEGPYVKSEYNPITNTGHEVCVWLYRDGIATIQKLDGPERGTIQYAPDGVNFEIKARASHMPDAFGLYRPGDSDPAPYEGVRWGLCHSLRSDGVPGGWMYLRRFDLVRVAVAEVDPVKIGQVTIQAEAFTKTGNTKGSKPGGFDGVNATEIGINWVNSGDWMEYAVDVPSDGMYAVTYWISTPVDGAKVQFQLGGKTHSDDVVPNNGGWDDYRAVVAKSLIEIRKGKHVVKLVASGSNQWQWNLEHFELAKVREIASEGR